MNVYTYDIVLEDPALLSQFGGEPNSATSYPFVPGPVLRGALLSAYARAHGVRLPEGVWNDPVAVALFFDTKTRFLNGYPSFQDDGETRRGLPVPATWHQEKDALRRQRENDPAPPIHDVARAGLDETGGWKRMGDGRFFRLTDEQTIALTRPDRQVAIHTTRDRKAGRAKRDAGTVYRYESLRAGQRFRAHVLCDWDANGGEVLARAAERLAALTGVGVITIGGARTAGYGAAKLDAMGQEPANVWREAGDAAAEAGEGAVITLLSDAVLRDACGLPSTSAEALAEAVSVATGVTLAPEDVSTLGARARVVGGFNRAWGMPLPQTPALAMGSVFRLTIPLTSEQARLLEWQGIGERRNEGFGRVAVGLLSPDAVVDVAQDRKRKTSEVAITDATSKVIAARLAERMLRTTLDAKLMERAQDLGAQIRRPSVSQLTRLQGIVRSELQRVAAAGPSLRKADAQQDNQRLKSYLTKLAERRATREQFGRGRFADSEHLLAWLNKRIDEPESILKVLGIGSDATPAIGDVRAEVSYPLAYEYALRLVHDTLAFAAKRKRSIGEER